MGNKVRKKDYIIFFLVVSLGLVLNIIDSSEAMYMAIIKILLIALLASFVLGSITNFLFKKKSK
jgi:hypothetical protein